MRARQTPHRWPQTVSPCNPKTLRIVRARSGRWDLACDPASCTHAPSSPALLDGRRNDSEGRPLHVPIRYWTKRGFARASPVNLIGCLACNGLWRPPSAAKWLSHSWGLGWPRGSFPAARGTSYSISARAGSATIMTGHAEGPGRDSLGSAGRLVARSHQGEPPSVPASGQAGHRDHCRQTGRRPDAGHLGQHHEAGRA